MRRLFSLRRNIKSSAVSTAALSTAAATEAPCTRGAPTKFGVKSVNYFVSRECNYSCKFCFHTAKNSDMLPLDEAKRGLRLLAESGCEKINFAGGEPFLHAKNLGKLVEYSSADLGLAVSIISNGTCSPPSLFRACACVRVRVRAVCHDVKGGRAGGRAGGGSLGRRVR
jgi:MoaA/NifB/PqqE/SkfB family radical SAM enzyme